MDKAKQRILQNLKNTYCRLKPSKVHGVGIFAIRDIPRGKNPFVDLKNSKYHKFTLKELKRLDKGVLEMIDDFFVIESDGNVWITENALNNIDISYFINHSKKPNMAIYDDKKNDSYSFKAIRNIKKGEELTIGYEEYDDSYKERFG